MPTASEVEEDGPLSASHKSIGVEHVVPSFEGVFQYGDHTLSTQPRQSEEHREQRRVVLERPKLVEKALERAAIDEDGMRQSFTSGTNAHTRMHTHIRTHTYAHTHTHTRTHASSQAHTCPGRT